MINQFQKRYIKLCPTEFLYWIANSIFADGSVELLEAVVLELEARIANDKEETGKVVKELRDKT
jgi:uncharacterized protein (DUF3820 family)